MIERKRRKTMAGGVIVVLLFILLASEAHEREREREKLRSHTQHRIQFLLRWCSLPSTLLLGRASKRCCARGVVSSVVAAPDPRVCTSLKERTGGWQHHHTFLRGLFSWERESKGTKIKREEDSKGRSSSSTQIVKTWTIAPTLDRQTCSYPKGLHNLEEKRLCFSPLQPQVLNQSSF